MPLDDLTPAWRLLADAAWQSTLLLAIGLLVARAIRRRRPARAHLVLMLAAAAALIAAPLAGGFRRVGLGLLSPPPVATVVGAPALPRADLDWAALDASAGSDWLISGQAAAIIIALAWATASLVLLVRVRVSVGRARRLVAAGRPPTLAEQGCLDAAARLAAIDRLPAVRVHRTLASPAAWRTRGADVLLVPADLLDLDEAELAAILAHETAHLQRRDHRHALGLAMLTAAMPWQPLAWVLRRRAAAVREAACDAVAARVLGSPVRYASLLCRLAERATAPAAPATTPNALVPGMATGDVRERIGQLLAPHAEPGCDPGGATTTPPAGPDRRFLWLAGIGALVVVLGTAALQVGRGLNGDPTGATPVMLPTNMSAGDGLWATPRTSLDEAAEASPLVASAVPLDLGTVGVGEVASGTLSLANAGTSPIEIQALRPGCGCITILDDVIPITLAPGETVDIRLTMEAPDIADRTKSKKLMVIARGLDRINVPIVIHTRPDVAG